MSKPKGYLIPLNSVTGQVLSGSISPQATTYTTYPNPISIRWVDPNTHFWDDDMAYRYITKGRSSCGVQLNSLRTGLSYYMGATCFDQMIKDGASIVNGVINGRWGFVKKGTSISIFYIPTGSTVPCANP